MRRFYVHDQAGHVVGEGIRFLDVQTAYRRVLPEPDDLRIFMTVGHFDALLEEASYEVFWLDGIDVPTPKGGHQ